MTSSCCIAWTALELTLQPKLVSCCWILLLEPPKGWLCRQTLLPWFTYTISNFSTLL